MIKNCEYKYIKSLNVKKLLDKGYFCCNTKYLAVSSNDNKIGIWDLNNLISNVIFL